jgi:hypothetical protein
MYLLVPIPATSRPCRYFLHHTDLSVLGKIKNTATLTWWEGLCLFDVKKADLRQSEIKYLARASSILLN